VSAGSDAGRGRTASAAKGSGARALACRALMYSSSDGRGGRLGARERGGGKLLGARAARLLGAGGRLRLGGGGGSCRTVGAALAGRTEARIGGGGGVADFCRTGGGGGPDGLLRVFSASLCGFAGGLESRFAVMARLA